MSDFDALLVLSETDPEAYRSKIERLRKEDPPEFRRLLEHVRGEIARAGFSRERRISSITALVRGDIDQLVEKHRARK